MRKFTFTIIFIGLLFLGFFAFPKNLFACSTLSVNPPSGPQGTAFTATASGCDPGVFSYAAWMTRPDGTTVDLATPVASVDGVMTFPIGGNPSQVGTYEVRILLGPETEDRRNVKASANFEVTLNEDNEIPVDRPYFCGETTTFSAPTCSAEAPYNCCPSLCPNASRGDGTFFCKIDTPYICSATKYSSGDDSVGVTSPFGCIPIANINYTASFFLSLGASTIGGIGLLMMIWGSYLVMSARGDSRQVQGGKELITAALSAILFLIFSVFIFRFIGTQILGIL